MVVLDSLLPVFLIIALGATLTATGVLTAERRQALNWSAYWIGMPALLFASVCRAEVAAGRPLRIFAVLLAATASVAILAWIAARLLRAPRAAMGTFIQGAFRGNLVFLALPIAIYVFDRPGAAGASEPVAPVIALAIAPLMIFYNLVSVAVLLGSHLDLTWRSARVFLREILLHPLVLAIAAGLVVSALDLPVPDFAFASLKTVGGLAIPAALLGIGGTLAASPLRTHFPAATGAALLKVAVAPSIGWLLARALHFPALDLKIVVLLLGAPTAAASFILAAQMRGDLGLASSIVLVSTILSLGSFAFAIAVL